MLTWSWLPYSTTVLPSPFLSYWRGKKNVLLLWFSQAWYPELLAHPPHQKRKKNPCFETSQCQEKLTHGTLMKDVCTCLWNSILSFWLASSLVGRLGKEAVGPKITSLKYFMLWSLFHDLHCFVALKQILSATVSFTFQTLSILASKGVNTFSDIFILELFFFVLESRMNVKTRNSNLRLDFFLCFCICFLITARFFLCSSIQCLHRNV